MALKLFSVMFILLASANTWAENGSSGIGTAAIVPGYSALNFKGKVGKKNDIIFDKETNENILKSVKLDKLEIDFTKLSQSKLGMIMGFEFNPSQNSKKENYWVLCPEKENYCYKLIPLSKTNKKIPSILGSLIEIKK
jgi:hypothetical protein